MRLRREAPAPEVDPTRGFELRAVGHAYGERVVLTDIDLRLTERRIGVVGANGSGKSTLARLLNGLVVPATGASVARRTLTGRRPPAAVARSPGSSGAPGRRWPRPRQP